MQRQTLVAALVAVVVGGLIGHFLWASPSPSRGVMIVGLIEGATSVANPGASNDGFDVCYDDSQLSSPSPVATSPVYALKSDPSLTITISRVLQSEPVSSKPCLSSSVSSKANSAASP